MNWPTKILNLHPGLRSSSYKVLIRVTAGNLAGEVRSGILSTRVVSNNTQYIITPDEQFSDVPNTISTRIKLSYQHPTSVNNIDWLIDENTDFHLDTAGRIYIGKPASGNGINKLNSVEGIEIIPHLSGKNRVK